jgi:membrane protein required for colicin V production
MGFNLLDAALLLVMLLFMIRGFFRGFMDEVAGLVSIVGGIWLAGMFHVRLGKLLLPYIADPIWANMVAFVLILCATMLIVAAVAAILRKILALAFAGWLNHLAGGVAGLAKGFVICVIAIGLMQHFLADAPFMESSKVRPHVTRFSAIVINLLPLDVTAPASPAVPNAPNAPDAPQSFLPVPRNLAHPGGIVPRRIRIPS